MRVREYSRVPFLVERSGPTWRPRNSCGKDAYIAALPWRAATRFGASQQGAHPDTSLVRAAAVAAAAVRHARNRHLAAQTAPPASVGASSGRSALLLASVACASAATRRAGCFTARALRACRGIDGEGWGKGSMYRLPGTVLERASSRGIGFCEPTALRISGPTLAQRQAHPTIPASARARGKTKCAWETDAATLAGLCPRQLVAAADGQ